LWVKRDDLTGFAFGGNKGRKLEYLMAEAVAQGAGVAVTCGAAQSNFIRQLGAACAVLGMRCVAAVMALPFEPGFEAGPEVRRPGLAATGNLLLDGLLGVEVRAFPDGSWEELYAHAAALAAEERARGERVYEVPIGGSSPLGAYAFVQSAAELNAGPFDWVVCPSSSGATHVGLAYAFAGTRTRVLGVACDPEPALREDLAAMALALDARLGRGARLRPEDFELSYGAVGPGYGVPGEVGDAAIRWLARTEGLFLDPVYSGKAFAGLVQAVEAGTIGGRVLFWHTGGLPALFAS
jgi:1-aminocyclopropane-1-carboxylate deaminase/D-cysteine desulfhydrase-like pyridoxal-dependent ACC family enzyme